MSCGGDMKERRPWGGREPPAKPFTPFSIEDILSRAPDARGSPPPRLRSPPPKLRTGGSPPQSASPLCALEKLASKTFGGLEMGVLQAAEGKGAHPPPSPPPPSPPPPPSSPSSSSPPS
ncbi:transcription factor LBX2-like, partial [Phyllobates terribilis]|uniref:transcription factor LBX2-like n=1 Tax=Phyllobates terribilis TaxID=111132 RepID=UPI003CCB5E63